MFEAFLNYFLVIADVFKAVYAFVLSLFGGDNGAAEPDVEDLIDSAMNSF